MSERSRPDTRPHLTNREDELLVLLAEECAEVQQAVAKLLRHGRDCHNPNDPRKETNIDALGREVGDLLAAVDLLIRFRIIDPDSAAATKLRAHDAGKTPLYYLKGATSDE